MPSGIEPKAVSAAAVKALRDRTNAPMMDCKAALTEAQGDLDQAADILRKKNKAIQDKKGDRETAEGRIAAYIDLGKQVGALVEMRCESAPVAKSEHFIALVDPRHTKIPESSFPQCSRCISYSTPARA